MELLLNLCTRSCRLPDDCRLLRRELALCKNHITFNLVAAGLQQIGHIGSCLAFAFLAHQIGAKLSVHVKNPSDQASSHL